VYTPPKGGVNKSLESWSISTALCVLSGSDEIGSFSVIVWSCWWWAPGQGDCLVASSRLLDQRQRRPEDQKCWPGNVVRSGDVDWLTVNDVGWECLRLVYSSRPGTRGLVLETAMHCDSQFVVNTLWDVKPVQFLMQQVYNLLYRNVISDNANLSQTDSLLVETVNHLWRHVHCCNDVTFSAMRCNHMHMQLSCIAPPFLPLSSLF